MGWEKWYVFQKGILNLYYYLLYSNPLERGHFALYYSRGIEGKYGAEFLLSIYQEMQN